MAIDVVTEIITQAKAIIAAELPTYSALDYEHFIGKNNFQVKNKRYGFIALGSDFVGGRAIQKVTMNQTFQMILITDFNNQDDETALNLATNTLIEASHDILKKMINTKMNVPTTADRQVLLVSGISIEEPEYIDDNCVVVIRTNLNIQYRYKL